MINGRNSHTKQIQEINGRMPPLPLWSPHLAIRSIHKRQRLEASSASFRHRGRLILHAQESESPLVGRHSNQQVLVNSLQLTKYMNYLREHAWATVQETAPSWEWCNGRWSKTGLLKHRRKWLVCSHQQVRHGLLRGKQRKLHDETWGYGCRFMAFCHRAHANPQNLGTLWQWEPEKRLWLGCIKLVLWCTLCAIISCTSCTSLQMPRFQLLGAPWWQIGALLIAPNIIPIWLSTAHDGVAPTSCHGYC